MSEAHGGKTDSTYIQSHRVRLHLQFPGIRAFRNNVIEPVDKDRRGIGDSVDDGSACVTGRLRAGNVHGERDGQGKGNAA